MIDKSNDRPAVVASYNNEVEYPTLPQPTPQTAKRKGTEKNEQSPTGIIAAIQQQKPTCIIASSQTDPSQAPT